MMGVFFACFYFWVIWSHIYVSVSYYVRTAAISLCKMTAVRRLSLAMQFLSLAVSLQPPLSENTATNTDICEYTYYTLDCVDICILIIFVDTFAENKTDLIV